MTVNISLVDADYLTGLIAQASQPWPVDWQAWYLRGMNEPLGLLAPERAEALARAMPQHMPLVQSDHGWLWHADTFSSTERSLVMQGISRDLRDQGQLQGWRNELFACWGWIDSAWPYIQPELFRIERAAFRYFGLRSHAAHVHGFTPDGRMYCGRRALNKATDPGLLDNLAAGGLPVDEQPIECALREIYEEAGLERLVKDLSLDACEILTEWPVVEGWHSERLFLFSLLLTDTEHPQNRDGEVSEFHCMDIAEVIQRLKNGQFTPDAACAIAKTLMHDFRSFDFSLLKPL